MLRNLLKFELGFQIKSVGFWLTVIVMIGFGLILSFPDLALGTEGGQKIKANGANVIAGFISSLSLAAILFGAVFVVNGVLRDDIYKSVEVIHSTPVKTTDMILSRMLAAWFVVTICISATLIGALIGQFMPWADADSFGPFNALYYLYPLVVFVIVNALFVTSVYTAIATLSRNKSMVYVSAIGVLVLYIGAGMLGGDNMPEWYAPMVDPFGERALMEVTQYWSASEQNTRLVPINSYVGLNRLLWGSLGISLFALSFVLSKRGIVMRKTKRNKFADVVEGGDIVLNPVTPKLGFSHAISSFLRRLSYEYVTTVRSVPFIILVGIALVLFALIIWAVSVGEPDPTLPTSSFMSRIVLGSLGIPMLIIMVFFGGDIVWRERTAGIHEILDATPVKSASLLAAKWVAISLVLWTIIFVGIIVGMIAQLILSGGVTDLNVMVYLKTGLLAFGISFVLQAFLVMFIQNFMPSRIVGMLVAAGVIIGLGFIGQLPFFHPLMDYASVSPGRLSEMSGYADLSAFFPFLIYWSSLAILLAIISVWIYRRGTQAGVMTRLKNLTRAITIPSGALAALAIAGFIGTGVHIYGAFEDGEYRNTGERRERLADYERLVKEQENDLMPKVTAVTAKVDFFPKRKEAIVSGTMEIINPFDEPITEFVMMAASRHEEDARIWNVEGASHVTGEDYADALAEYDYRIFRFDTPLAPGATSKVEFETFYHAPKLGDGSFMVRNGTFVNNSQVMPQMGYVMRYHQNPDRRRKEGLPEKENLPERDDMEARQRGFFDAHADYVDFEATVCTDDSQIGIAPGDLLRTYDEEKGRTCRDYRAVQPIANFFSFLSGDYVVARDEWNAPDGRTIPLEIFYDEAHDYNIELMLKAMSDSLETFTRLYGPYQYDQLRIIEFPYRSFAQSFAGTVPFSENIGFVRDPGDPEDNESVDLATYVTMHEIGHQWFGHQILPAQTKGFNVLSEGLTENSAMTAYEEQLGWQKAKRVLEQRSIQGYLMGRTFESDDEKPLALSEGAQYLDYNKASWVFWGLKQYMGEAKMQGAIQKFVADYGYKGAPFPTTLELTNYLREAAGPDYDQLITDYWDRITFWDLEFVEDTEPEVKPNSAGSYDVTVQIAVDKLIASMEDGEESSVTEMDDESLNEWVEIGFYTTDPEETRGDEWLALERVRVSEAETTHTFSMDKAPSWVVLDPRRLLIERNVTDNVVQIDGDQASAE